MSDYIKQITDSMSNLMQVSNKRVYKKNNR